jgi:16S rRNA (uracil1498-N3)-methyltransferase
MLAALAQCEGAWLPALYPDATPERAVAATPEGTRLLLDPDGAPLASVPLDGPVTIALGPEGGFEPDEHERLVAAGFAPVALAGNILRLETAGIAALSVVRSMLAPRPTGDGHAG